MEGGLRLGLRWRGTGGVKSWTRGKGKGTETRITVTVNLVLPETINRGSLQNLLKKTPVSYAPTPSPVPNTYVSLGAGICQSIYKELLISKLISPNEG